MIFYQSTREDKKKYSFSEVILKGIAPDGGLFVPEKIPKVSLKHLQKLPHTSYAACALFLLDLFETDFSKNILKKLTKDAYGKDSNFDVSEIISLKNLKENEYMLELWHGPTWSFKDMALQIMPYLFAEALEKDNKKRRKEKQKPLHYLILAATSGDTGKAALEGYKNKRNVSIIVFFPDKKISSIQELSMLTQDGNNTQVYSVSGNFDDVQTLVKTIFTDDNFIKKILKFYSAVLSAANSINWGRLLPQVIYHFFSYKELVERKIIKIGDEIDIAVPSGNFGNILAAFIAKEIGLPVRKLICASNENNILSEFLQTGTFTITKRKLQSTHSPAMDILIPSNIERLLFFMTKDTKQIANWMSQLKEKREFTVDDKTRKKLQEVFYSDWVSNEDCLQCIKDTFNQTGYLMDPHTAVIQQVVNKYKRTQDKQIPIVICSTAHWAKFPSDVYLAIFGKQNDTLNDFQKIEQIQKLTKSSFPKKLKELYKKPLLHKEKLNPKKELVEEKIMEFLDTHIRFWTSKNDIR